MSINNLTDETLAELRQIIQAATAGQWRAEDDDWSDGDNAIITCDARNGMVPIAVVSSGGSAPDSKPPFSTQQQANARFIARANPAVVLALLNEIQQHRKAAGESVGYVSESALFGLSFGEHHIITGKPEKDGDNERYWDVIPLYAAPQPVPVVPGSENNVAELPASGQDTLRQLAIILSGSDAPGEIKLLTVTAQSFVERCKKLARDSDIAMQNVRDVAHCLSDIRRFVESRFRLVADLPSPEGLLRNGPEWKHESDAIIAALARVADYYENGHCGDGSTSTGDSASDT